jgi:MoaA/NifB/PqqE/SkfB family radical SAM enzyme
MPPSRRLWLQDRPPSAPGSSDSKPVIHSVLSELAGIGARLQLSVVSAPSPASQLAARVTDTGGSALTLLFERAREARTYYRREGGLGFWYAREPAATDQRPAWIRPLLDAVAAVLPRLEPLAHELPDADRPSAGASPIPGPAEVERFFHVDYQFERGADVDQLPTTRIGVIYQCNQPCTFCQLREMNTHIPPARIYAALEASAARGARRVIFTGGEPTMCTELPVYLSRARALGYEVVELQTNATLLDHPPRAVELKAAGLTDAQVSLHGPDADVSDRLTAAPGTHQRTLAGISQLLEAGVRVLLNHLVFRDNAHLLLDFVELVERRWGPHRDRVTLQFHAPLHEFPNDDEARRHIARYSEYATPLRHAIDRARAVGLRVRDLQDPTGIPALCVLGADPAYLGLIRAQSLKPRLHRWEVSGMTHVAACARCELVSACMGIPKRYVELHGDREFRPLSAAGTPID